MSIDKQIESPEFLSGKKVWLVLLFVFAASLSLRLYKLDSQTLECDELYTIPAATGHQYVYLSSEPNAIQARIPITTHEYKALLQPEPGVGLRSIAGVLKRNVHLPLYFSFMHYWVALFGTSERALRLPSAVFGALATLMIFLLGRELFGPLVGCVSSLLMALSPEQIYFSQQARMYSLLPLLVISSTYALVLVRKHSANRWLYFAYSLIDKCHDIVYTEKCHDIVYSSLKTRK